MRRAENERPWYGGGTRKVEVNKTGGPPLFRVVWTGWSENEKESRRLSMGVTRRL